MSECLMIVTTMSIKTIYASLTVVTFWITKSNAIVYVYGALILLKWLSLVHALQVIMYSDTSSPFVNNLLCALGWCSWCGHLEMKKICIVKQRRAWPWGCVPEQDGCFQQSCSRLPSPAPFHADFRICAVRCGRQRRTGQAVRRDWRTQRRGSEPAALQCAIILLSWS